jgi:membrane fusion protein (multidrug efflux system)
MPDGSKPISETTSAQPLPKRRRALRRVLMIGGPLAVLVGVGIAYMSGGRYAETDNAYVHTHKVTVSADISGRVVTLNVHENEPVKAGQVLFQLDPEPLQIAIDRARADLEGARNEIIGLKAAYRQRREDLKGAESCRPRVEAAREAGRRQDHLAVGL